MRNTLMAVAMAALFASVASASPQQSAGAQSQNPSAQNSPASASTTSSSSPASPASSTSPTQAAQPTDSLAEVARKARAAKQEATKAPKVFTNDNIPTTGGISAVGSASTEQGAGTTSTEPVGSGGGSYPDGNDEKGWRRLFLNLNHKLQQDQELLDVSQRELGVLDTQYYNDPSKAMMQQYTRSDINKKTAAIDEKRKQVEADKQAISDAQDALRRAGGDPGWAE
jgi:hypothetical protein